MSVVPGVTDRSHFAPLPLSGPALPTSSYLLILRPHATSVGVPPLWGAGPGHLSGSCGLFGCGITLILAHWRWRGLFAPRFARRTTSCLCHVPRWIMFCHLKAATPDLGSRRFAKRWLRGSSPLLRSPARPGLCLCSAAATSLAPGFSAVSRSVRAGRVACAWVRPCFPALQLPPVDCSALPRCMLFWLVPGCLRSWYSSPAPSSHMLQALASTLHRRQSLPLSACRVLVRQNRTGSPCVFASASSW